MGGIVNFGPERTFVFSDEEFAMIERLAESAQTTPRALVEAALREMAEKIAAGKKA